MVSYTVAIALGGVNVAVCLVEVVVPVALPEDFLDPPPQAARARASDTTMATAGRIGRTRRIAPDVESTRPGARPVNICDRLPT